MDDKIIAIFCLCDDLLKAMGLSPPGGLRVPPAIVRPPVPVLPPRIAHARPVAPAHSAACPARCPPEAYRLGARALKVLPQSSVDYRGVAVPGVVCLAAYRLSPPGRHMIRDALKLFGGLMGVLLSLSPPCEHA